MIKIIERILDWFTTANISYIDEATVDFYRQNPDQIDEIEKEGRVHRLVLPVGFVAGLILVFTSKLIRFWNLFGDALFFNEVIVDLAFELGVAIWGGVVTTAFLEVIENRERKANQRYRAEILHRIKIAEHAENTSA